MSGCDHSDISHFAPVIAGSACSYFMNLHFLAESPNEMEYKKGRLETGITKPMIFLGLLCNHALEISGCFRLDIMHLAIFNLSDLFMFLWCGVLDCNVLNPISSWPWAILQSEI